MGYSIEPTNFIRNILQLLVCFLQGGAVLADAAEGTRRIILILIFNFYNDNATTSDRAHHDVKNGGRRTQTESVFLTG